MAFVNIQKAQVERIIQDKGFVAVESYTTRNGEEKQTKYTIWTDNPNEIPGEGVIVNVSGALSVRVQEFVNDEQETVQFAQIHVNRPKITLLDMPQSAPQVARETAPPSLDWEAPF